MDSLVVILAIVFSLAAIFALYWSVGYIFRAIRHRQMKRQGRTMPWSQALERVQGKDGFLIIAVSGKNRELLYACGNVPSDLGSVRDVYYSRAALIEDYNGKITVTDLKTSGTGDRCVEMNVEALVV